MLSKSNYDSPDNTENWNQVLQIWSSRLIMGNNILKRTVLGIKLHWLGEEQQLRKMNKERFLHRLLFLTMNITKSSNFCTCTHKYTDMIPILSLVPPTDAFVYMQAHTYTFLHFIAFFFSLGLGKKTKGTYLDGVHGQCRLIFLSQDSSIFLEENI